MSSEIQIGPCKHGVIDDVCVACTMESLSTTGPDTKVLVHWSGVPDESCAKNTGLKTITDLISSHRSVTNCIACLGWSPVESHP